jgi:biopolymer transport protein ExbD
LTVNFRARLKPDPVGFQMTPMIDVVFLLLCFFVTSQVFSQWEAEVDITLPTARTSEAPQRLPGEIIINILKTAPPWSTGAPWRSPRWPAC